MRKSTDERSHEAECARDALIVELELLGGASSSNVSLRDFMASFMRHKEDSGTIEPSTVRGHRAETRIICRYLGSVRLAVLFIPGASSWMRDMGADGYAPQEPPQGVPPAQADAQVGRHPEPRLQESLRLPQAAQAREDADSLPAVTTAPA